MNILYKNIGVVSQNTKRQVYPQIDLLIEGDQIKHMGAIRKAPRNTKIIDGEGMVALPGFVNTHVHLGEGLFPYLVQPQLPLEEYLKQVDRIYKQYPIIESSRHIVADNTLAELIALGTTAVGGGRVGKAAAGWNMLHLSGLTLMNSAKLSGYLKALDTPSSHVALEEEQGFFIQSLSKVPKSALLAVSRITKENPLFKIMAHVSETRDEEGYVKKQYGKTSVEVLNSYGLLNSRTVLVHCNWFSKKDWSLVRKAGTKVIHCPSSNLLCADKTIDIAEVKKNGVGWALATDGKATSWNLDLIQEMKTAYVYHDSFGKPQVTYQELFDAITCNAASVLGLNEIGSLEAGKRADIVIMKNRMPMRLVSNNREAFFASLHSGDIQEVYIAGKGRLRSGQIKLAKKKFDELLQKIKPL